MTKTKLAGLAVTLLGLIYGAAVQQGVVTLPAGVCPPAPPAPVCGK